MIFLFIYYLFFNTTSFCLQAMLMTKGLMDRSFHHEMALERVHVKAKLVEEELFELKNWKVVRSKSLSSLNMPGMNIRR